MLDPTFTAAYFDETGLYAYGRQPDTLLWNLTRLAECLLPFADRRSWRPCCAASSRNSRTPSTPPCCAASDCVRPARLKTTALVRAVWKFLLESKAPFEQFFFDWYGGLASETRAADSAQALHYASPAFAPVHAAFAAHEAEPANGHFCTQISYKPYFWYISYC